MAKYNFDERSGKSLQEGVTLIVVTSPIPTHPSTSLIDDAIESVMKMNYKFKDMVISYDKARSSSPQYNSYKKKMRTKWPQFKHLEMKGHGHFIGTFHNALKHCKTKHFFLLQHDIKLHGTFPINECLQSPETWNIVATHHFTTDKPEPTHWFPIMKASADKKMMKSWGWSERIFLSKRDWMMDKIHEYYHNGKTKDFIESIFHKEFDKLWRKEEGIKSFHDISTSGTHMKVYNKFWQEWKTFNLKSSVAYHIHMHGRTAKKTMKGGAISSDKTHKTHKTFMKQYGSISNENCAKKHSKSRSDTLRCLKGKKSQKLALQKKYPEEFKEFQKQVKLFEKKKKDMFNNMMKCSKAHPMRSPAFNKCLKKGPTYASVHEAFPLVSKILDTEGMDSVHEVIDIPKLNALFKTHKKATKSKKSKKSKKGGGRSRARSRGRPRGRSRDRSRGRSRAQ